jgi:hypothetical protein
MEFEEILQGVTDETLKANLKAKFQEVNQKAGEFGRKLIEKDTEIGGLKTEKQTYSKAYEAMKKSDIAPDQIPKLLEKLGYQKSMEEEYNITKVVLDETKKEKSELAKENARLKAEKAMGKTFDKIRAELKDEKGQPVSLSDKFINFEELYSVQDFTNETVLQEKCKQVLTKAFTAQTEVLRDIGFVGAKTHTTPDGKQVTTPTVLNLAEVMKTQGAAAAIAAMHANNTQKG